MILTQIQLTEREASRRKTLAAARGVSVAELIRQGVHAFSSSAGQSDPKQRWRRAVDVIGRFHPNKADVSSRHDHYLAEAHPA